MREADPYLILLLSCLLLDRASKIKQEMALSVIEGTEMHKNSEKQC